MARAETIQPQGRGDTKERGKKFLGGAALGAAQGAFSEFKRQRSALIDEGVGNVPPVQGRLAGVRRGIAREVALGRQIGIIDVGRAALIGAGKGAAIAGVAEVGSRIPTSSQKSSRV